MQGRKVKRRGQVSVDIPKGKKNPLETVWRTAKVGDS
jgi:hypothetical protein